MNSVLIKLSGESLFGSRPDGLGKNNINLIQSVVDQISSIRKTHKVGIVVGGGNFFRASKQGIDLGLRRSSADSVGMIATVMNGLILHDFFERNGVPSEVLSAFEIFGVVPVISNQRIEKALSENKVIIFAGGTGNPFFTTDTCAVLRALQIGSNLVWKVTSVDGVYDSDPRKNSNAKFLKQLKYSDFIGNNLEVMDLTAISLAQKHNIKIKVFNLFAEDALRKAASDVNFGSTIE